jgi:hypothetical protein
VTAPLQQTNAERFKCASVAHAPQHELRILRRTGMILDLSRKN